MAERIWPKYSYKDAFQHVSFWCKTCREHINLTAAQQSQHDANQEVTWDLNQITCLVEDHNCVLVDARLPRGERVVVQV